MGEEEDLVIQLAKQRQQAQEIVSKGQVQGRYGVSLLRTTQQRQQLTQAQQILPQLQTSNIQQLQQTQQQPISTPLDNLVLALKTNNPSNLSRIDLIKYNNIQKSNINLTAIDRKDVLAKLQKAGISSADSEILANQFRPEFKVYGSQSQGLIAQQARIEAAKKAGLSTSTRAENIPSQFAPYGFSIKDEFGKIYTGTENFIKGLELKANQPKEEEYDRLQKVLPTVGYYNEFTGEIKTSVPAYGEAGFRLGFTKVYLDPRTNKPIEDISKYIKENNIPVSQPEDISKLSSTAQMISQLNASLEPKDLSQIKQEKVSLSQRVPITPINLVKLEYEKIKSVIPSYEQAKEFTSETLKGLYELTTTQGQAERRARESTYIDKFINESTIKGHADVQKYLSEEAERNPEIQTATTVTAIGLSLVSPLSLSTKTAILINYPNIKTLIKPVGEVTPEQKVLSASKLGIDLGISAAEGLLAGVLFKGAELGLETAGYATLKQLASLKTESDLTKIGISTIGQSLKAAGALARFSSDVYFKSLLIGGGLNIAENIKEQQYITAGEEFNKLVGSSIGFMGGGKLTQEGFKLGYKLSLRYAGIREELPNIKKEPSNIQIEKITQPDSDIYIYRSGLIPSGGKIKPQFDIYKPSDIKNPTEQIFFRTEYTKGVGGEDIQPALTKPSFTKDIGILEAYKFNLEKFKSRGGYRFIKAFAELPLLKATIVDKIPTKEIDPLLREIIIKESSTGEAKLSETSQKEILNQDTLLSDKLREREFSSEQEISLRNDFLLEKPKLFFGFTESGELVPIIARKGVLNPVEQAFRGDKIIVQQDAAYIERNFKQQQKFLDEAVQPAQHSYPHAKEVKSNVEQLIEAYHEFKDYFIKKYGSLDITKKELGKGALAHDLGKTASSSIEFGKEHGEKVFDVYEGKGQGKMIISLIADYGSLSDPFAPKFNFFKEIYTDKSLLPIELKKEVAEAIKTHQTLNPKSLGYKVKDVLGLITPEEKILSTADRLNLGREGINRQIDSERLPLKDALKRLNRDKNNIQTESLEVQKINEGTQAIRDEISRIEYEKAKSKKIKEYVSKVINEKYYSSKLNEINSYSNEYSKKEYSYNSDYKKYGEYNAPYNLNYPTEYKKIDIYVKPYDYELKYPNIKEYGKYPLEIVPLTAFKIKQFSWQEEPKQNKQLITNQQGFNVYVKEATLKGQQKQFVKVNKQPLTLSTAKDEGAYLTDTSLAKTFAVRPTKGKPSEIANLNVPKGYYEATQDKFRQFKVKKGMKINTPMTFIEKKQFGLDSPQEVQKITLAKRITQIKKDKGQQMQDYALSL